jgi:hypothetical protein
MFSFLAKKIKIDRIKAANQLIILGFPHELNVITRVLKMKRGREKRIKEMAV